MCRALQLAIALAFAAWLTPSSAFAYEDQIVAELGVGYTAVPSNDALPTHGAHVTASALWGIKRVWSIRTLGTYSLQPDDTPLHMVWLGVEGLYALDVVRFVPLFGIGIDGLLLLADGNTDADFALHATLGIDYHINRRWILGLDARAYWLPAELADNFEPFYITAGLHAGFKFNR